MNFFQTLPDKENNYLIYQEMNKVADMVDNDRFNLLLEHLSHVLHSPGDLFALSLRRLLVPAQA